MPLFDFRDQREKDRDRWKSIAAASLAPVVPGGLYAAAVIRPDLRKTPPGDLLLDPGNLTIHPRRSGAFIRAGTTLSDELTGAELDYLKGLTNAGERTVILNVSNNEKIPGNLYAHGADVDAINVPDLRNIRKDILAHEMVHSSMSNEGTLNNARRLLAKIPKLAPIGLGAVGSMFIDPDSNAQSAGLLGAQALLEAPNLFEEALANRGAYRAMRQLHAEGSVSSAALRASKATLLKNMGSYGVAALGGLLGTAGIVAARRGAFED